MSQIKFNQNWNNKLALEYFSTIRLWTRDKFSYYSKQKEEVCIFDVLVKGEKYSEAHLVLLEINELKYIPEWLCYLDAGMNREEFMRFMEKLYSAKPEWQGDKTKVLILVFKKVIK